MKKTIFGLIFLLTLVLFATKEAKAALFRQQVCYLSSTSNINCTRYSPTSSTFFDRFGNALTCTQPGTPVAKGCTFKENNLIGYPPSPTPGI